MVDQELKARPLLGGADVIIGDNRVLELDDIALVSVAIPLDGEAALAKALRDNFDLDLPDHDKGVATGNARAIRTTADQLMLLLPRAEGHAHGQVRSKLEGVAYTTDQSDGWICLEVSGPDLHPALERLCPLDIADAAFPVGHAARTTMEHMGALIVRHQADAFLLLSASSSGQSFLHAVETSFRNVID